MSKYKRIVMLVSPLGLILLVIGISYSFFNYTKTGQANNLGTGQIYFNTTEGPTLNLTNLFPMTSEESSNANLDSISVVIEGNTTYSDGEEYEITLVDVTNTINGKQIPLNYMATYTPNTDKIIGTPSADYWNDREDKDANIYLLNATGEVKDGKQVLVGYVDNGDTGIEGTLTIKAYINADRIAISDTYYENATATPTPTAPNDEYGTTTEWVDDRVVLTETEWNSLTNTPISFKIRAESNEGIWVEPESTPDEFFGRGLIEKFKYNNDRLSSDIDDCVNYLTSEGLDNDVLSGESLLDFCSGTGTLNGDNINTWIEDNIFTYSEIEYLVDYNIIDSYLDSKIILSEYDVAGGLDVIIPSKMAVYEYNDNRSADDVENCKDYLYSMYNEPSMTSQIRDYCAGTATIGGKTINENLLRGSYSIEMVKELVKLNIAKLSSQEYPVVEIGPSYVYFAFRNKGITSVIIPNTVEKINYGAFSNNELTNVKLPSSLKTIDSYAFSGNNLESIIIPNGVELIESNAFRDNQITSVSIPNSVTTIGTDSFSYNNVSELSVDLSEIPNDFVTNIGITYLLTHVVLGDNVTSVGKNAFNNNNLVSIVVSDSLYNSLTYNCDGEHTDTIANNGVLIVNRSNTYSCPILAKYDGHHSM